MRKLMTRKSTWILAAAWVGLLMIPWLAEGAIVVGGTEVDGISPVFAVDNEGAQRETSILVNPANNLNLVMGWNERSGGRLAGQGFVSSFDYGATWGTSGEISDGLAHSDPALCASPTGGALGTVVFTYIHNDFSGVRARRSFDGGVTFPGPAVVVHADSGAGGAGTDKNWAVTDLEPTSPGFDTMYMTVTEFGGSAATTPDDTIFLSASVDQGATWPVTNVALDTPGDGLIVTGSNVDVFGNTGATAHVWWEGTGPSPAPFDIQLTSRVTNGGGVIAPPFSVPATGTPALPSLTPMPTTGDFYGDINSGLTGSDFRVNSFPYIAVDTNPASPFFKNVYVVSTNATAAALVGGTDADVMLWRFPAGALAGTLVGPATRGTTPAIPILNDDGGTADQFFPSITVAPDGAVEVFWVDTRNDPGGSPRARFDIYYTCSVDGGVTWSANTRITPATFTQAGNTFIGDYDDSTTNRGGAAGGGGHTWRSYVVQNAGGAGTDPVVQAVNNTSPVASLTGPTNIDCAVASTPVTFDASGTTDVDSDPLTYSWTVTAVNAETGFPFSTSTGTTPSLTITLPFTLPSGNTYTTTVTATDLFGATSTAMVVTTVTDTTPPVVTAGLLRTLLWPARRGMIPAGFSASVTDDCDPAPVMTVEVWSDEANGTAPFAPDASGATTAASLRLRMERAYPGNGRVYLVIVRATDGSGNTSAAVCMTSIVPVMPVGFWILSARSQATAAQVFCLANDAAPAGYVLLHTYTIP